MLRNKIKFINFNLFNIFEKTINHRVLSAVFTIGFLTFVVKIADTFKHLIIAHQFGRSDALDAFLIAFLLPSFGVSVIARSLNSAFLPTYVQVKEHDGFIAAHQLFSSIIFCSTILIIVFSLLLILLSPYLISALGSGFSIEKKELSISLFNIAIFILVINTFTTILISVLNSDEQFGIAAISPVIIPIVVVFFLLVLKEKIGIYSLAAGTTIGMFLQTALLAYIIKLRGFKIIPKWYGFDTALMQIAKQYLPMVAGAFLMASTSLVDQAMAAMLEPGSVSALNYGNKVVSFLLGIGAVALGTAVFPLFSRLVATNDLASLRLTLKNYTKTILLLTIPITAIVFFYSDTIIKILFERGEFTATDTAIVGKVQALYAIQIPFYVLSTIGVRMLNALKKNQILMVIAAVNLIANIILNFILMKYFGVSGISLSTSIVYIISTLLIFLSLNNELIRIGL